MAISFQLSASEDNPKMNLKDYMAYATDKLLSNYLLVKQMCSCQIIH